MYFGGTGSLEAAGFCNGTIGGHRVAQRGGRVHQEDPWISLKNSRDWGGGGLGGSKKLHFMRRVQTALLERSKERVGRSTLQDLSQTFPYGDPGRPMLTGGSRRPERNESK